MKLFKNTKYIFFIIMFFSFNLVLAQGGPGDFGGGDIDEIPINGLVVVGLIAGAALGIKKTKK